MLFTSLGALMAFLLKEGKVLEKDETYGEVGGRLIFTDGSRLEIEYSTYRPSDAGTEWV